MTAFRNPDAIVTADWLQENLSEPNLRIFDCTTILELEEDTDRPYRIVSDRAGYEQGHIPGAGYLDLQGDFSDPDGQFAFTMPEAKTLATAFGRHGIGDSTRVVLYSRTTLPWATRFWWMLRVIGFDNASILDGGYAKWVAEGHPTSRDGTAYAAETLTPKPRPDLFVGRDAMIASIDDPHTVTINALSEELHKGEMCRYGRAGRIPGSVNVPAASVVRAGTQELLAPTHLREAMAEAGAFDADRVITYCGGGIFATLDAFLLHQLGHDNVAVYDNSMTEWGYDPDLPLETG